MSKTLARDHAQSTRAQIVADAGFAKALPTEAVALLLNGDLAMDMRILGKLEVDVAESADADRVAAAVGRRKLRPCESMSVVSADFCDVSA